MNVIGRAKEENELLERYSSDNSEFVAIYGRRRVGKTYLVNTTFNGVFDFMHTGLSPIELEDLKEKNKGKTFLDLQLEHFYHSLKLYGMTEKHIPKDWLEAFYMLEKLLQDKEKDDKHRKLIFIDELPWLDTPKSFFITALGSFWNSWACHKNVMLVVCGSATTWMLNKLVNNHGGLYGRLTHEIHLTPFTLGSIAEFFAKNHISFSKYDIVQTYMILGGIPYYLKYIEKGKSLAANIDKLFFSKSAPLANEFNRLFSSSYSDGELVKSIVRALFTKKVGLTRDEIASACEISDGERLSKAINALLANDCIIKYRPLQEKEQLYYRLVDPFCLFYLRFVENKSSLDVDLFSDNIETQSVITWRGLSFENVCFNHINEIKKALGIKGVGATYSSFYYDAEEGKHGAQIDLILVRNDNVVNLCEMKFYSDLFSSNENNHLNLVRKKEALSLFLKKKQYIETVLVTTYGIKRNEYQWDYENIVTIDELFSR